MVILWFSNIFSSGPVAEAPPPGNWSRPLFPTVFLRFSYIFSSGPVAGAVPPGITGSGC